jgi:hypothetical protein
MNDLNSYNNRNEEADSDDWLTQGLAEDDLSEDNFSAPVMKRMTINHHIQKLLMVAVPASVVGLLFLLVPRQWMGNLAANAAGLLDGLRINSLLMDSLKTTGQSFGPSEVIGIMLVLVFFLVASIVEHRA